MRKEEKKPLRYITSGMVAMNFCWGRVDMGVAGGPPGALDPPHSPGPPAPAHLGQVEGVGEVHGHVRLGQVHDEPRAHVQEAHLWANRGAGSGVRQGPSPLPPAGTLRASCS